MTAGRLRPGSPGEGLAIIAGGGALPRILAQESREAGWNPFVVAIADGINQDWSDWPSKSLGWHRTGDIFSLLRSKNIDTVVFCGTISVRPDYRSLMPSFKTLAMLPEIFRIVIGGDDSLLRNVSAAFERRGFTVVAVHALAPSILAPAGVLTRHTPSEVHRRAIMRAVTAADSLGRLDVGQAVVASPDRVIALEGIEGTREMLARVGDLRKRGRIGRGEPCVLLKAAKPQQDDRFDLPSIGPETIQEVADAGIAGVVVSGERALMIDAQAILEAADGHGIFVLGYKEGLI